MSQLLLVLARSAHSARPVLVRTFLIVLGAIAFFPPATSAANLAASLSQGTLSVTGTDDPDNLVLRLASNSQTLQILDFATIPPTIRSFPVGDVEGIDVSGGEGGDRIVLDPDVAALDIPITIAGGPGADRIVSIDLPNLTARDLSTDPEQLLEQARALHALGYEQLLAKLPSLWREIYYGLVQTSRRHLAEGQALVAASSRQRLDDTSRRMQETLDLFQELGAIYVEPTVRSRYDAALADLRAVIPPALNELGRSIEADDPEVDDRVEKITEDVDLALERFFATVAELDGEPSEDGGPSDGSGRKISRLAGKLLRDIEKASDQLAHEPALDVTGAEAFATRVEAELLETAESLVSLAEERFVQRAEEVHRLAEQLFEQAMKAAEHATAAAPRPMVTESNPAVLARLGAFDCNINSLITISGDDDDDWLLGTPFSDSISGGAGVDVIFGWSGNDLIHGNAGGDRLLGGSGQDEIHGDDGDDFALGGTDGDCIFGEADNDVLLGQAGGDAIDGGAGVDVMFGGAGDDLMQGADDTDVMLGNRDNDTMRGGDGIDLMFGDVDFTAGNQDQDEIHGEDGRVVSNLSNVDLHIGNLMFGNQGRDVMYGGDGIDAIFGNRDDDEIHGGDQADFLWGDTGDDDIKGGKGGVLFQINGVPIRLGNLMFGNQDKDSITGGPDLDVAFGNQGNDMIEGGDGSSLPLTTALDNDFLFGNQGEDTINGGRGSDVIFGNQGDDVLDGDTGAGNILSPSFDLIFGNQGDDRIDGGRDLDLLFGNQGEDVLDGGRGWDLIFGNQDDDRIDGGRGWDLIFGNRGCDQIDGSRGWDLIFGNQGLDQIDGGRGWDLIFGNRGPDTIQGGNGWDLIFGNRGHDVVDGGHGLDLLFGGQGNDIVIGGSGWNLHFGLSGDDSLLGGDRLDVMFGNEGEDCLEGADGIDIMFGNRDDDEMRGDRKTDLMLGGRGNDVMLGGRGWDVMCGGPGTDMMDGGPGIDFLWGNSGADQLWTGPGFLPLDYLRGGSKHRGSSDLEVVCNRPANRCIRGIKFHDFNGNGLRDPGEPTLPGWTITATRSDGEVYSTVTGADGSYAFCDLRSDCYEVEETVQTCWGATTPIVRQVELSAVQDEVGIDFGNRRRASGVGEPIVDYSQGCDQFGGFNAQVTIPVRRCDVSFTCAGSLASGQVEDNPNACVFVGVPPGDHVYTVTIDGMPVTVPVTVGATVAIVGVEVEDPSPDECLDGSITLDVFSQFSPLSVRWHDQTLNEDLEAFKDQLSAEGLEPGTYVVTVTDENDCFASEEVTLNCIEGLLEVTANVVPEEECDRSGALTSTVTLHIEGGDGPFVCDAPGDGQPIQEAVDRQCIIKNVPPGTYTYMVTESGSEGATGTVEVEVEKLRRIQLELTSSCAKASATVTATGGQEPYTYRWTPSGQREATARLLKLGTYTVLVTDDGDCRNTAEVTLDCECPDPSDPMVFYATDDPSQCPDLLECSPSQSVFHNACGCGCIPGEIGPPTPRYWDLRLLATSIASVRGRARGGFEGFDSDIEIGSSTGVSLGLEFALGSRFGVELAVLIADGEVDTSSQLPSADGAPGVIRERRSGDVAVTSLGITYHLLASRRPDVYLGAFLSTVEVPDPPLFEADGDLGFGGVLGIELPFGSRPWSLDLRLRYLNAELDLTRSSTGERSQIELDPWITDLGISYRF